MYIKINALILALSIIFLKSMSQDFSIHKNSLIDNISYYSPCHTALNDTIEIKCITQQKITFPRVSAVKFSYEMPLINNKLGLGVAFGYEYYFLDWEHHYPIHEYQNTYMSSISLRYKLLMDFNVSGRFNYYHTNFYSETFLENSIKTYTNTNLHFDNAIGISYNKNHFLTGLYYNFSHKYNAINVLITNDFNIKSNVIKPYLYFMSYDIFNISFIEIYGKYGLYYKRNWLFGNIEFLGDNLTTISLGYSLLNNSLKISFSYFFNDIFKQPTSVFNNEKIYFSNTISYKP
jgi:hypothetical protein